MNNKPLLAFDCANGGASISLCVKGKTATHHIPQNRQAAELVSTIDASMQAAGLAYADLGAIITTIGPGSFTGLRIGLAALHGLILVTPIPIKTLTTLDAMAWSVAHMAKAPTDFFVAMRAGKGEVYAQSFRHDGQMIQPTSEIFFKSETYTDWELPCFTNHIAMDSTYYLAGPDTEIMCQIAPYLNETPLHQALPLYIRPPDAKLPG